MLREADRERWNIQPVTPETLPFVVDYCVRCITGRPTAEDFLNLLERYRERLAGENYWCFVALAGAEPVGYVDLEVRTYEGERTLWVSELYVRGDWRRQGIGTALLRKALAWAGEQGWPALYASTETENAAARRVLRKVGFRPERTIFRGRPGEK
ncbi:MAG: GNAT family N-acetyltransferase [Chloroflexia bacterium]